MSRRIRRRNGSLGDVGRSAGWRSSDGGSSAALTILFALAIAFFAMLFVIAIATFEDTASTPADQNTDLTDD